MVPWHRLFGITLTDYFKGTGFEVEMEKDLSIKKQFLDIVILKKKGGVTGTLPDGFDNLADHNLITYKSIHQPLDGWALLELTSHYVNYRKQVSKSFNSLEPIDKFCLYGISTRYPKKLSEQVELVRDTMKGVYNVSWGILNIRIIVISEMSQEKRNALWYLFSGDPEKVSYGALNYEIKSEETSTIFHKLIEKYRTEGIKMSYTMEAFRREVGKEVALENLNFLSPEDRLKGLSPDEVLQRFSPDEVLQRFSPDDRLQGLSPEVIREYLAKIEDKNK